MILCRIMSGKKRCATHLAESTRGLILGLSVRTFWCRMMSECQEYTTTILWEWEKGMEIFLNLLKWVKCSSTWLAEKTGMWPSHEQYSLVVTLGFRVEEWITYEFYLLWSICRIKAEDVIFYLFSLCFAGWHCIADWNIWCLLRGMYGRKKESRDRVLV